MNEIQLNEMRWIRGETEGDRNGKTGMKRIGSKRKSGRILLLNRTDHIQMQLHPIYSHISNGYIVTV